MTKRDIFGELMSGVKEMAAHRQGKITLRTFKIKHSAKPRISGKAIRKVREELNCSRAVFACMLHTSPRTLEKWEQGRAKPNAQAATLVRLVEKYPDTLEKLQNVAG
ncbi:MAG TPA: helix-turn-helix domain-containing protein [Candidatus Angelobacter sp.]|nr:helix-turn-helix domain-containing protein [Candidatus Angelobacter sp.]